MVTALDWIFYGNPTRAWLIALGVAVLTYLALRLVQGLALRSLQHFAGRTRTSIDDLIAETLRATRAWFRLGVALWAGTHALLLTDRLRLLLEHLVVLLVLAQLGVWATVAIRAHVRGYTDRRAQEDAASVTTVRALGFLASVALWALLLLMALENVGIDITALVAGLGIGGIAIALAVQNVLGDLFASLSIVLDKPFVYGDYIVVGDLSGTVEHVGLKTTRVRSLSGEQLVFSNSDLLQSRIRNYKRMQERRAVFALGVVYQTPPDVVARIPTLLREAIEDQPDLRFDRAHFTAFGPSSLDFEAVYYVLDSAYNTYMDRQQAINLQLLRRFEAEGIEFAYPTQTLFLVPPPAAG